MSLLERRQSPRFPFHTDGNVVVGQVEQSGTVIDLSASGVLFSTGREITRAVGEHCALKLLIGAWPGAVLFEGVVVSQRQQLLGIEFTNLAGISRTALEQIVEMNLGIPQLLDRDVPALLDQLHDGGEIDACVA